MKLEAPFYAQTMEFSCGSACALMALGHFGMAGPLDRDLEVEVWRETQAVEIGGCGRYGVAAPLALRGLRPHIISSADGQGLMERIHERVAGVELSQFDAEYPAGPPDSRAPLSCGGA